MRGGGAGCANAQRGSAVPPTTARPERAKDRRFIDTTSSEESASLKAFALATESRPHFNRANNPTDSRGFLSRTALPSNTPVTSPQPRAGRRYRDADSSGLICDFLLNRRYLIIRLYMRWSERDHWSFLSIPNFARNSAGSRLPTASQNPSSS